MAWDTSTLTPDVHAQLAAGASIEAVAERLGVPAGAIRQYLRKVDKAGRPREHASIRLQPRPPRTHDRSGAALPVPIPRAPLRIFDDPIDDALLKELL